MKKYLTSATLGLGYALAVNVCAWLVFVLLAIVDASTLALLADIAVIIASAWLCYALAKRSKVHGSFFLSAVIGNILSYAVMTFWMYSYPEFWVELAPYSGGGLLPGLLRGIEFHFARLQIAFTVGAVILITGIILAVIKHIDKKHDLKYEKQSVA